MFIFSRTTKLGKGVSGPGFLRAQMKWTFDLTDKFNEINPEVMRLWTNTMSPANGTYVWSSWANDLADLEEQNHRLAADEEFLALVAEGAEYTSEVAHDSVFEVLYSPAEGDIDAVPFVIITRAVAAPGQIARATELGVAIAERSTAASGSPTYFTEALTGPVGTFEWIRLASSIEELQASYATLKSDPEMADLDQQSASVFAEGTQDRRILRRQRRA